MSEKQKPARWMGAALYGHFALWSRSLRTILMLVFSLMMNYMLTKSAGAMIASRGLQVHMGELLYSYLHMGFQMLMASLAFFVMMSEIPKQVPYHKYAAIRLSRRRWLSSLVLFCMLIVLAYLLLMAVSSVLFSIPYVTAGGGWSDLERLAADADYVYEVPFIPTYIFLNLSPFTACVMAGTVLFMFWTSMAFVIVLSSLYRVPNVGIVICVTVITGTTVILVESLPGLRLPDQFSTAGEIASQFPDHEVQAIGLAICGWAVINALLVAWMAWRVRHMDIEFSGKE